MAANAHVLALLFACADGHADQGFDGGVALENGREVCANIFAKVRRIGKGLVKDEADLHRPHIVVSELLREVVRERLFQPLIVEDRRVDETREGGLGGSHANGFFPEIRPHGIAGCKLLGDDRHGPFFHG